MTISGAPTKPAALIAQQLVTARRAHRSLPAFPGALPLDLAAAYACQDIAIASYPDQLVGWKVGGIPPPWQPRLGESRLMGPIFATNLRMATNGVVDFPIFAGGFAAVEAEIVFRLGMDPPAERSAISPHDAMLLVDAVFAGVETAGSPLKQINVLGPLAVVSDFGNNFGLILGAQLGDGRYSEAPIVCHTDIDGTAVGNYVLADGLRAPLEALVFALRRSMTRRWPLKRGDLISTGALTGIHAISDKELAVITFEGHPPIACRAHHAPAEANA